MSDEFIQIATQEINGEITNFENILNSCNNNGDANQNASEFQKYTHKIKGLAPMMGKENLGEMAALLDNILKKTIDGQAIEGIFEILTESFPYMKKSMNEPDSDLSSIIEKLKTL